ncbi:MAG: glycosyltransferase family 2 protein [Imperialibacter sp.]|uniref:glycosyltransferase family 2 protein n=1 Tax=Imperialibacter sp. TaxID=2038411 RepID=UPI003A84CC3D
MKLSIILPVYNVEAYLERCIRSLEDQGIPRSDYEIIVVNDGSPDNSKEVVERLQRELSNIILINQENQGVSMARNAGIDRAGGEYLVFVDPDDYVAPNSFSSILTAVDRHKPQIVFLGYRFLNVDESIRKEILHQDKDGKVFRGIEAYVLSRGDGKTDPDRSWGILFERAFINKFNIRYLANVPYLEDGEFLARALCLAEKCSFHSYPFYQRTTRPGSATHSSLFYSDKSLEGFILAAKNLLEFSRGEFLDKDQRTFLNQPICKFVLLVLVPFCSFRQLKEFKRRKGKLYAMGLDKCELEGCNNYYKVEGFLFNQSPYLFFLHRALKSPILKLINP